jgi:restriction endonuclease S subunit
MKLRKDKWVNVKVEEVCKTTSGGTPLRTNYDYYNGNIPWIKSGELHNKYVSSAEEYISELGVKNSLAKIFPTNTVLVAMYGVTSGTCSILKIDAATNQAVCGILPNEDKLNHEFLYSVLSFKKEEIFKKRVGTYQLNVTQEVIRKTEIPLPPLEAQKQIADLFQSIETAMEQLDGQEKNLKALQKSLVNSLSGKEPVFGNLLNTKNCTPTTFGEIAECDKKYPEHEKEVERFVGLENIEPDNFQLQGFGLVANGTTFTKRFAKGDVLFGKRRAYLRKLRLPVLMEFVLVIFL